jgi:hypothetical protein
LVRSGREYASLRQPIGTYRSGQAVLDVDRQFRGYRGTGADVTALVRAQEEHERLRQLESELAHELPERNGRTGRLVGSRDHATDRQRSQQRPCGPEPATASARSGKPSVVWQAAPMDPATLSAGSMITSRKHTRESHTLVSLR